MSLRGAEYLGHAGNEAAIDAVRTLNEVLVGEVNAQRLAQDGEVGSGWNLTSLVSFVGVVDRESLGDQARITPCPGSPKLEGASEIEVDDDTPEVE